MNLTEREKIVSGIEPRTTVDLFFQIKWQSTGVSHTDGYAAKYVNLWRDVLPRRLTHNLIGKHPGDLIQLSMPVDELLASDGIHSLVQINRSQFDSTRIIPRRIQPRLGRYYPKGALKDLAGIFSVNITPFRIVDQNNGRLTIDMNHPLSNKKIGLSVTVGTIGSKPFERGGSLYHWGEVITDGVGMQARWQNTPTHFFDDRPFAKTNDTPDADFFKTPRLVHHLDTTATDVVRQIYSRFLQDGLRVLDLMSSWRSHLHEGVKLKQLTGLGLNTFEMERNPQLNDHTVQDLNQRPLLPYGSKSYDLVICTASVEYLTRPFEVFSEVARVLRPEGTFVVVFSNRWFDPKVTRIWTELHEFERMGLVLEYFHRDKFFSDLHTFSVRGLARPSEDKYISHTPYSDPIYAVWGRRK